jgi:hypothetical protein
VSVEPEEPSEKFRKDLGRTVLIAGICVSVVSFVHPDIHFAFFAGLALALLGLYLEKTGTLPFM